MKTKKVIKMPEREQLSTTQPKEKTKSKLHLSFTNLYRNSNGSLSYNEGATQFYIPNRLTFGKNVGL